MKKNIAILLLTAAIICLSSFSTDVNLNTTSNSTEETADNEMAEILKGVIEKEGIKTYKVTYTVDKKKKISILYDTCTFPGNNLISFWESENRIDVGFNLNHLIRYAVFKKDFKREESIRRLELLF